MNTDTPPRTGRDADHVSRRGRLALLAAGAWLLCVASGGAADTPRQAPAPSQKAVLSQGTGAFATGKYRNLFAEAGHPHVEIDAKIDDGDLNSGNFVQVNPTRVMLILAQP